MRYPPLVSEQATDAIPRGAALLENDARATAVCGLPDAHTLWVLSAVVSCPGSLAVNLGDVGWADGRKVSARLRRLRETGLVQSRGPSPARWYPGAGRRLIGRERLTMLRSRAREARRQAIGTTARAEALYAFADTLTQPAPQHLLCPLPRRRTLSFRELAYTLRQSEGCDVSVSTDIDRVWPQVRPIAAIGIIDNVAEERGSIPDDWLITLTVGEAAFVEFSRRHFETAYEDWRHGELCVRQQGQTTAIWFEPPIL
jgi:hypothetical protein